jgi:aspartyl-tRNA(Asn)/glutamyl-tRNA(Gln) amidotransferase subunit B
LTRLGEDSVDKEQVARTVANWGTMELFRRINAAGVGIAESKVTPSGMADLMAMMHRGAINQNSAKRVLDVMFGTGRDPGEIVEELGLRQTSDASALGAVIAQVLAHSSDEVARYRSGQTSVFGWLMGQVMRETQGKAKPSLVKQLLEEALADAAAE